MTPTEITAKLLEYLTPYYPDMDIDVVDEEDQKRHIYFTTRVFANRYPVQRNHNIIHNIPKDFYETELTETIWYELAPGENPDDLDIWMMKQLPKLKTPFTLYLQNALLLYNS